MGAGGSSFSGKIEAGESDSVTGIGRGGVPPPTGAPATGEGLVEEAGLRSTIEPGLAACHFSIPSRPPSSAAAKPLPLTVWMWTTTGRCASSAWPRAHLRSATSWPSITPR